jgi:hypothetical protein
VAPLRLRVVRLVSSVLAPLQLQMQSSVYCLER